MSDIMLAGMIMIGFVFGALIMIAREVSRDLDREETWYEPYEGDGDW